MNPMTNVKNITKLNEREIQLGIKSTCSWHKIYQKSPWLFVGGLDYDLTEGDVICVFSQYGEIEDINLIRDKKTGKSKGFGFLCYQNNKSTILAVDNLNGIKLCGRTIRVDHVANYRPPKEESESSRDEGSAEEDIMDIIDPKRKKGRKRLGEQEVDRENRKAARIADFGHNSNAQNRDRRDRNGAKHPGRSADGRTFYARRESPDGHFRRRFRRADSDSDQSDERLGTKHDWRKERENSGDRRTWDKSKHRSEKYAPHSHTKHR